MNDLDIQGNELRLIYILSHDFLYVTLNCPSVIVFDRLNVGNTFQLFVFHCNCVSFEPL